MNSSPSSTTAELCGFRQMSFPSELVSLPEKGVRFCRWFAAFSSSSSSCFSLALLLFLLLLAVGPFLQAKFRVEA